VLFLFTCNICDGYINFCFDGHRLATLCGKLSQLQSLSFVVELRLINKPNNDIISEFTKTFCTPFWVNGPLGRIRVCVCYNSTYNAIETYSLPYMFPDHALFHTIDIIDVQFNISEDKRQIPIDLSVALEPLWYNIKQVMLSFGEQKQIPLIFLRALHCPSRDHSK
jgi:hypothetical protein